MARDPDAFAEMVVMTVKATVAPILERLALSEQQNRDLQARVTELLSLRDRVTVVETKAAEVRHVEPVAVDLGPMLERIAAAETRIAVLGDLRDRVVTVEAKAAQPISTPVLEPSTQMDLSPVLERIAAAEARLNVLGDLRDRVVTVETKAAQPLSLPVMEPPEPVDLSPVTDRLVALEKRVTEDMKLSEVGDEANTHRFIELQQRVSELVQRLTSVEARTPTTELWDAMKASAVEIRERLKSLEPLPSELTSLRERLAVAEVRQFIPGPPGKDGVNGRDGVNGKDGLDGMGWDDLAVKHDGERTFTVQLIKGERVKEAGVFTVPVPIYRFVWMEGKTYEPGDRVTWGGSEWHCSETTTSKPGDGSKAWTLAVKRGRDGKDGTNGRDYVPVVRVGT